MRWKTGKRSENVEDRRGRGAMMGAVGIAPLVFRFLPYLIKSKTGRTILMLGAVAFFGTRMLGIDILPMILGGNAGGGSQSSGQQELSAADQEAGEFVSFVLADTELTWQRIFTQMGRTYQEPRLVLFTGQVTSACGAASAAVGPFYCPGDQQLYIDLAFFRDLSVRHDAPGDFAQAYVLAHEVGHHVQTLLGISEQVQSAKRGRSTTEVNALSVMQELQADCFAGIWGNAADGDRNLLESGDLEEALVAATAIGDDQLQRDAGRRVVPSSFTHGSSEQRVRWFSQGFNTGNVDACNTYESRSL